MAEESRALAAMKRACCWRAGSTLALAATLLVTARAQADDAKAATSRSLEAPAPTPAAEPMHAQAEDPAALLYDQAYARYADGDTAGALVLMEKSYEISGKPELLFNLGQLHAELRHCVEARQSYERYLALAQADSRRSEAEQQVRELTRECPEPPQPATSDSAPPSDRYWTPMRIAAWSTLGASLVFATSATYFAIHAKQLEHQVNGNIEAAGDSGYTQADKAVEDEGLHTAVVARSLGATSVGLALVGVSFLVFGTDKHEPATHGVSLRVGGDSLTAAYQGTF
jgi:hypothetical protein